MSIPNRLFVSFLVIQIQFCLQAQLQTTVIRQPGAVLDTSMQNEVDHAVRLSSQWIVARQHADGSWGSEASQHTLTAMGVIALQVAQITQATPAIQKGVAWLEKNVPPVGEKRLSTLAWYVLAFSFVPSESAARAEIVSQVVGQGNALAEARGATAQETTLWNEAVAALKIENDKVAEMGRSTTNQLAKLAASWPVVATNPETVWRLARMINRVADGRLVHQGAVLDWRTDLAKGVLSAFRIDPAGGGYWDAKTEEGRLQASLFGIFALCEL